ncbi:MAG: hypothetical protein COV44_04545 [Deltaproteobacteria bacterium CG11_big_fil_rev_8_21_14_0_20_45_16]|nr:MAG: hypothetical protein COV44_04545 [Deltaproteobacteria bacterium CG11_big_fil_rev_8_21_14_0_20_45_16]
MKKIYLLIVVLFAFLISSGCNSSGSSTGVTMEVDFATSALSSVLSNSVLNSRIRALETTCPEAASNDEPGYQADLDCDDDDGVIAYQTPTSYKIAFKSVYFLSGEDEKSYLLNFDSLDEIDKTGVIEFTSGDNSVKIDLPSDFNTSLIPTGVGFEVYYFELRFNLYGEETTVRIYMSDDDFTDQGSGGHHQGDITYLDGDGVEHWANGGSNWLSTPEATLERGEYANGDGGMDDETGHARGMFGSAVFWNATDLNQGADQDIFLVEVDLAAAENPSATVTFSIADTWFYENFDSDASSFDPCESDEACAAGAAWAPLFPDISVKN